VEPHVGPIRWGVAATGRIASEFATAFSQVDPAEDAAVVAVGSRADATARAFAEAHDIGRAHGSYAGLAADPDVDVVYVASLQPGHVDDAVRFLEAGKHVLVEKPFTLSAAEADRVITAARANDRFAMEAMWMRFTPGPTAVVDRIAAGAIGAVTSIDAEFTIRAPDDPHHRLRSLDAGGGSLLDLGVYPLTLACWIAGPPTSWRVEGTVAGGVDTHCVIEAAWPHMTARLVSGLDGPRSITATIVGTDGTIEIPEPFHATSSFTISTDDGSQRVETEPASLHHQVPEVHRCLRAGRTESPRNPWATTRAILEICDDVRTQLGVRYPSEG